MQKKLPKYLNFMNNMFGDDSFSKLLHTPYAQLQDMQPAMRQQEESFTVYVFSATTIRQKEVLKLDSRIDDESRIIFNTYEALLKRVFAREMDSPVTTLIVSKSSYDFSSLIAQLSRIWEIELNNSVVQIVRQIKGIEMPEYYRRLKTDRNRKPIEVSVKYGDKNIDLNDGKSKMMKEICWLLKMFYGKLSEFLGVKEEDFKNFTEKIDQIRKARNNASHTSVLTENDFHGFYEIFCDLIRENWLTILMDGKDRLKGILSQKVCP